jgi:hypothetical protein
MRGTKWATTDKSERNTASMTVNNKHNLIYFESPSMRGLYDHIREWKDANSKRLLSISIQQDGAGYCCIALTNPTEVVITSENGRDHVMVSPAGRLFTT